MTRHSKDLV